MEVGKKGSRIGEGGCGGGRGGGGLEVEEGTGDCGDLAAKREKEGVVAKAREKKRGGMGGGCGEGGFI